MFRNDPSGLMHASILVPRRVTFRPDLPLPHREPYHQTTMHVHALERVNVSYRYLASSAIEAFLGLPRPHVQLVRAAIDLVSVARLEGDVSFPGIDGWDALVTTLDGVVLLQCAEPDRLLPRRDLSYDRSLCVGYRHYGESDIWRVWCPS